MRRDWGGIAEGLHDEFIHADGERVDEVIAAGGAGEGGEDGVDAHVGSGDLVGAEDVDDHLGFEGEGEGGEELDDFLVEGFADEEGDGPVVRRGAGLEVVKGDLRLHFGLK